MGKTIQAGQAEPTEEQPCWLPFDSVAVCPISVDSAADPNRGTAWTTYEGDVRTD
jgi:hypothetical protein